MSPVVPLIAAIAPFIIWPIEFFLPYPYIIEEIAKGILIVIILDLPAKTTRIQLTLASAGVFALSETVLYIFNISLVGDLTTLFSRLILTAILHVVTMLIILIAAFGHRWLIPVGVAAAMIIHYLYNLVIPIIFT